MLPRADRGVERSGGVRLPEALFLEAEGRRSCSAWISSGHRHRGGAAVGSMDVESAVGPGIRVAAAGKARIKDLAIVPLKK